MMKTNGANQHPPLAVDLDGALVRSDLLIEACLTLLKQNPLYVFLLPLWLWRGKAVLKREIASRVQLDPERLPYHEVFLDWLREQRAAGRALLLCTAADERLANRVAMHLGLFTEVFASDGRTNLSGVRKAKALCERYGEKGFEYAGNASVDLAIWRHAGGAVLVNPCRGLEAKARTLTSVLRVFDDRPSHPWLWLRALRLHQWLKNLLLFVPLLAAHQLSDLERVGQALVAFLCFGFTASAAYILNDLLDLAADRRHPRKRLRPFAAGALPIQQGVLAIPILLLLAGLLTLLLLPPGFLLVLGLYLLFTLAYSFYLKQVVILDVIILAGLYTWRIIAGGVAIQISFSFWLLAFSMFLFLSLALVKRYAELLTLAEVGHTQTAGRDYCREDLALLLALGAAAGYSAIMVLALYINSPESARLYTEPRWLWLLCPLALYWISRVWLKTYRGEMHDDPIIFALRDRVSRTLIPVGGLILWGAL